MNWAAKPLDCNFGSSYNVHNVVFISPRCHQSTLSSLMSSVMNYSPQVPFMLFIQSVAQSQNTMSRVSVTYFCFSSYWQSCSNLACIPTDRLAGIHVSLFSGNPCNCDILSLSVVQTTIFSFYFHCFGLIATCEWSQLLSWENICLQHCLID